MFRSRSVCAAAAVLLTTLLVAAPAQAGSGLVKHGRSGQSYVWTPGSC